MKLLFDQNLSPRLADRLVDIFPYSAHVQIVGLERATDQQVWDFASKNDYVIVTKDVDFNELSLIFGFPPKVIWLRLGNCSTKKLELVFRQNQEAIEQLGQDVEASTLILF